MNHQHNPWKNKTILIADDSGIIRAQLAEFYQNMGLKIAGFATNGMEALSACEKLHPDIVSMDIIMPEMHGLDCFEHIRTEFPAIKVLFVSCLVINQILSDEILDHISRDLFLSKPPEKEAAEIALQLLFEEPGVGNTVSENSERVSGNHKEADVQKKFPDKLPPLPDVTESKRGDEA